MERLIGRIIIRNDFSLDIIISYFVSFFKLLNLENVLFDINCDLYIMKFLLYYIKILLKCIVLIRLKCF